MVSIIIPYKNPNPFFKECLNSIINQTYKNIQIILVNDHSTDDSEKTAINYQKSDSRIKTIKNNGNGIIDALNTGVKVANGKFITRMDSDDIMMDNKITELRTLLLISGRQHISLGCVKYFASDKKLGQGYINYAKWLNELTANSKNYSEIYKECTVPSSNWMMFRKDFNKINGFSNLNYPEDYDFAFRVLYKKIKIINTKKITHLWRDHPKRTSRNSEHYKYENFIPIKIKNLLLNELKNKEELILWGAGSKGKSIAKELINQNCKFKWISNNIKKIGHEIYGIIIEPLNILDSKKNKLVISAISSKNFKYLESSKINRIVNFY
jgi:glycosyltransferase involved in cell wall biosynthesis